MKKLVTILMLLLQMLFYTTGNAQKSKLPNIVIIMADDLGYGDFSSYGASKIITPNVDALAKKGMSFTDAHTASSLCTPSRYSLMTGRYSWRTSLRSGVLTWFGQPLIEPGRTTIASMLQRNGYYTACIGKWHLGFDWALKNNAPADPVKNVFQSWELSTQEHIDFSKKVQQGPVDRGFNYYYGITASNNMIPFVYIENDSVTQPPTVVKDYVYDTDQKTTRAANWDLEKMDELLTRQTVNVIDKHFAGNNSAPLFLYYPTSAIHRPCLPADTKGKSSAGLRGDMVLQFDWIVGEVVQALKRNGQFENTLLIVTSDNGAVPGDAVLPLERYHNDLGDKYNLPYLKNYIPQYVNDSGNAIGKKGWLTYDHPSSGIYRGFKSDAWEGGHRVPLIMHWPGKIKAGASNSNMVCNTDFMATLAELVNDHLTAKEGEDSYSFLDNVLGKNAVQKRNSMTIVAGGSGAFIVRQGSWKYIEPGKPAWGQTFYKEGPRTNEYQLYDLQSDPGEKKNLYKVMAGKAASLRQIIEQVTTHTHFESNK